MKKKHREENTSDNALIVKRTATRTRTHVAVRHARNVDSLGSCRLDSDDLVHLLPLLLPAFPPFPSSVPFFFGFASAASAAAV